jgi:hypothetical protein
VSPFWKGVLMAAQAIKFGYTSSVPKYLPFFSIKMN